EQNVHADRGRAPFADATRQFCDEHTWPGPLSVGAQTRLIYVDDRDRRIARCPWDEQLVEIERLESQDLQRNGIDCPDDKQADQEEQSRKPFASTPQEKASQPRRPGRRASYASRPRHPFR